jgi:SAM-dependent methyltransferase
MLNYYQQLCNEWGYTPTAPVCTGYESVEPALRALSKQRWVAANEAGRESIQQEVFDIYRSVNLVPINYYNLDGCREQVRELAHKYKSVENSKLGVGNNEGLAFGRFWFPNMQDARWNNNDTVSIRSRFMHDNKLKRAIKLAYQHRDEGADTALPKNIRRALELVNGGTIQNFKPMNARAVWEHICPVMFGDVLDFSSGYGGRMLGAMTSRFRYHYTGIDPNTRTYQGLQALGELLQEQDLGRGFDMNCVPSEDFEPEPGRYDAAFSSPPYFNLETYTNEPTQCMNRYNNLDRWFEGYVAPTLQMIHRALNSDGIYAVNIADYKNGKEQFEIVERWKNLSISMGFDHVETIEMMLNVRPGVGNNKLEKAYKSEGIYIFSKKTQ